MAISSIKHIVGFIKKLFLCGSFDLFKHMHEIDVHAWLNENKTRQKLIKRFVRTYNIRSRCFIHFPNFFPDTKKGPLFADLFILFHINGFKHQMKTRIYIRQQNSSIYNSKDYYGTSGKNDIFPPFFMWLWFLCQFASLQLISCVRFLTHITKYFFSMWLKKWRKIVIQCHSDQIEYRSVYHLYGNICWTFVLIWACFSFLVFTPVSHGSRNRNDIGEMLTIIWCACEKEINTNKIFNFRQGCGLWKDS